MKTLACLALSLLSASTLVHAQKPAPVKFPAPTGPTVVFDTTDGRLTCKVFGKEAPVTSEHFLKLATAGFYDASGIVGVTAGIGGSGKPEGDAGAEFPAEKTPALSLEHAGLLGMSVKKGSTSASRFMILEHGDNEAKGGFTPFGVCDDASIAKVEAISHKLLTVGNRPVHPVMINKVFVVKDGEALPPETPNGPEQTMTYMPLPGSEIPAPEPTGPTAVIETTMGTLTCKLFNETKEGTANFIGLATGTKDWKHPKTRATMHGKPFYNGLHFARVIPDFMVQQSDMPGDPSGDGTIGYHFGNEIIPGLSFDRPGRLAYANGGPNTNESEFFVTEHEVHRLDGNFTIFGQCDPPSVKVVEAIARVPRNADNKPLTPVAIRSVTISK